MGVLNVQWCNTIIDMTETNNLLNNIAMDIIIINTIWGLLDNPTHKSIFGICMSAYIITKYV